MVQTDIAPKSAQKLCDFAPIAISHIYQGKSVMVFLPDLQGLIFGKILDFDFWIDCL